MLCTSGVVDDVIPARIPSAEMTQMKRLLEVTYRASTRPRVVFSLDRSVFLG